MEFSFSSFLSSTIAISFLTFVLYFLLNKTKVIFYYGIYSVYIFALLILLRGYLPYDFYKIKLTTSFYSDKILLFLKKIYDFQFVQINDFFITVEKVFLIVWFLGSTIFLIKIINGYFSFRKILLKTDKVNDIKISENFNEIFAIVFPGKKNNCRLVKSDFFGTPAIFGFKSAIIILPDIQYNDEELRLVFHHELLHLKHMDFLIKVIADLLVSIHWWNPCINHLLFPMINQLQELYVDHVICKEMTEFEKVVYMNVLHKSVKYSCFKNNYKKHIYALADEQKENNILQRLQYIINYNSHTFSLIGVLFISFTFMLSFTFVFEPIYMPNKDEIGSKVFYFSEYESFYIKNGFNYDLYLNNEFVFTAPNILEEFKDIPIYNNMEETK